MHVYNSSPPKIWLARLLILCVSRNMNSNKPGSAFFTFVKSVCAKKIAPFAKTNFGVLMLIIAKMWANDPFQSSNHS